MTALLATAFTAGLVATVNPCGFAMLPAYLGFFLGKGATTGQALRVGAIVSFGFLSVFTVAGAVVAAGVTVLAQVVPWLAIAVGAGLVAGGLWFASGRYLTVRLPALRGRKESDWLSLFVFGVSYATASLSCTIGAFLALVGVTFTQASFGGALLAFLVYGLGMSLVLVAVTVAVALGRDSLVARLRRASRHVAKFSGLIMIGSGAFIIWYWLSILAQGSVVAGTGGAARFVERVSSAATSFIGGRPSTVAVLALAVIGALVISGRRRQRREKRDPQPVG